MSEAKTLLLAGTPVVQVARRLGYSNFNSLQRLFRQQVGRTPAEWMREQGESLVPEQSQRAIRRLNDAKRLLREGRMTIDEIAHVAGYSHISSLYAAFDREHGVSPGAWRKATSEGGDKPDA